MHTPGSFGILELCIISGHLHLHGPIHLHLFNSRTSIGQPSSFERRALNRVLDEAKIFACHFGHSHQMKPHDDMAADLQKIAPPRHLTEAQNDIVFQHFFRHLANHRNTAVLYSILQSSLLSSTKKEEANNQMAFEEEMNKWAQGLLEKAWMICHTRDDGEKCPETDPLSDTSTVDLDKMPAVEDVEKILNTILFFDITTSKQYSARTRTFLSNFGSLDEATVVATLKNPEHAIEEAQRQADAARTERAERGKTLRMLGVGLGAVAGGVLVGVTGGLAAPLVGAAVTTIFGWLGVGGTIVGLLANGLAGSSVVCGALFGVYGAQSTASMVERHTREVSDLSLIPVRKHKQGYDTLGVRLCISGWLNEKEDVTAPWTIFNGDDTFALQWEIRALEELSDALLALIKSQAMKYVKGEIIRRTIFAGLMNSLAPLALLKIGQIIDNPWMNARALAIKTGAVLGDLLANRMLGTRPVTLVGYSLGSLVIFEALKYLASLPPAGTVHLIQDVYLFGTPTAADPEEWAKIRRLVAGRVVNGYSTNDYILAVLCRASDATWQVAGLQKVDVKGVENVCCEEVDGHTNWRWVIGKYLEESNAPGIVQGEVKAQTDAGKRLGEVDATQEASSASPAA
ncbi:unnamed protein product [Cyclocybe aegerita]|uniref:DUF726-domain-containing protein n=1 Tax=Cyclocybe aegerita TaxID=1973307 RepID=A0A8S0W5Q1_CYCAE|nr:unnamed protein product [Cyclocybe aegerita]